MTTAVTSLAYDQDGQGFAIAFVHGLTFSRATWRPIVDRLADRFRCVSVDLPGHGDTPGPAQTLDGVADSLHQTVTSLAIDRPVVVGHSMSAVIATIYGAKYPTSGVVNLDQALNVRPFAEIVRRMAPAFAQAFEPFRQSIGIEALPPAMRSQVAATQVIRQDVVLGYWAEILGTPPADLQARIDGIADAVAVPYLAVMGQALGEEDREQFRRHLPAAQIEEWPGLGHMVHLAEPDRFAERLAHFAGSCSCA